jgi:hypothetical protein
MAGIPSLTVNPVDAARRRGEEPTAADWATCARLAARMAGQARTRREARECASVARQAADEAGKLAFRSPDGADAARIARWAAEDAANSVSTFDHDEHVPMEAIRSREGWIRYLREIGR